MEKLYMALTLEKIDNEPIGEATTRIDNYRELFGKKSVIQKPNSDSTSVVQNSESKMGDSNWFQWLFNLMGRKRVSQKVKPFVPLSQKNKNVEPERGQKVLLKGDPGMGKTSLCKKVSWDWARKLFTTFSVTFLVFLKLVKPGDAIENVIIEQNPHMEGLKVSPGKLHNILETFGNSCLVILDGLDEHALGTNEDVKKIIRGQKYLNCNIIVTSRPHSTKEIERYFPVIARIEGFTYVRAVQFASKILSSKQNIAAVLKFNPTRSNNVPIYKSPILLSFLCLLVREEDIDLSETTVHVGEIYTRMVRCLYKKFTIRKGIDFKRDQFFESMARIGKLALKTLISGDPLMRRSDVIREVGPDAFDYGLLIGHEDFRLIQDEAADILVTFPHRSIQEFLGAFFLVWMLDKGVPIEYLFAFEGKYPVFMINPLLLQFCLWNLCCSEKYLDFENRSQLYDFLVSMCLNYISDNTLDTEYVATTYPALDIEAIVKTNDELHLKFLLDILLSCNKINHIAVADTVVYVWKGPDFPLTPLKKLDWVLHSMGSITKNLKFIKCDITEAHVSYISEKHVAVNSNMASASALNVILKHYNMNGLSVHLCLENPVESLDRFTIRDLRTLHVRIPHRYAPELEDPILGRCLKKLSCLSLVGCRSTRYISFLLCQSHLPELKQLNLLYTNLTEVDLEILCLACNGETKTMPELKSLSLTLNDALTANTVKEHLFALPWMTLESMHLHCSEEFHGEMEECLCDGIDESKVPNLKCLGIEHNSAAGTFQLGKPFLQTIQRVESLVLCNGLPPEELRGYLIHLSRLEFRSCSALSGHLSILLREGLLALQSLVLSNCKLYSNDLRKLAEAYKSNNLPRLKHVDLSKNVMTVSEFAHLFDNSCTWNQLLSLDIRGTLLSSHCVAEFWTKVKIDDLLTSLQEFMLDSYPDVKTYRTNLKTLGLSQCTSESLQNVIDNIDQGNLPVLRTICFQEFEPYDATVVNSLSERNIDCHKIFASFATTKCYCQME